eukprot:CAMPEP_0201115466 /NCGR_PEP_ID=MMETSP0812-20130820/78945_1 /ASSEMBLY_ACC=CAM_ASM_000668 /TAXON_ID=98059 /ORGANISM="Dinobryon sp., Strain UTEXLB2267" /LENGTH=418 /DNA_ID=CAMNT_0047379167 /DNA_START=1 /DNA_END=1253 /DNA_ORIENTATION=-
MPMTDDWLAHLEDLASKSPSDPAAMLEFRPGFEATPEDVREQVLSEEASGHFMEPTSVPLPHAPTPERPPPQSPAVGPASPAPVSSSTSTSPPTTVGTPMRVRPAPPSTQQQQGGATGVVTSPVAGRRVSFGPAVSATTPAPVPAVSTPAKPVLKPPAPSVVPPPQPDPPPPDTRRSGRQPKPNLQYASDYVVNMAKVYKYQYEMEMDFALEEPESTFSYVASADDDEAYDEDPRIDDLFTFMGDHEDQYNDLVALQITLEAALKTQYKEDVEACAIKEVLNVIKHKTWTYLKSVKDAEQSIHTNVLPCQMVVKDKRDSKGQLLLWKGRLANGGHRTDPTAYLPFDKTSPTATIDAVFAFLAVAQRNKMQVETNDVPAAYLNAPLAKGKKHVMRISKILAKYVCAADPRAKAYLQPDG